MEKPDKYPDWALDDVVDPTSGQNNVAEPPAGRANNGWNRHETPPRQWFNWLGRYIARWIRWAEFWIDDALADIDNLQEASDANNWLTSVSGTNTITASIDQVTAYSAGQTFRFIPANANSGSVTININGIGAADVVKKDINTLALSPLVNGCMLANEIYEISYNGSVFVLQNPSGPEIVGVGSFAGTDLSVDLRNVINVIGNIQILENNNHPVGIYHVLINTSIDTTREISAGSGVNLIWMNGPLTTTGTRQLGPGAVATLLHLSANNWYIWGNDGLS